VLPRCSVLICLFVLLTVPGVAHASLRSDLAAIVARHPLGGATSLSVVRASDGTVVYSRRASRPVTPASNEKLLTTAGVLQTFGPDARLRTRLALTGSRQGVVWNGNLYLIGGGDPTLSTASFARRNYKGKAALLDSLVDRLDALGISRIRGKLIADESRFDHQRWVGSWPRRFRFDEATALGALSVNQSYLGSSLEGLSSHEPALRAAFLLRTQMDARGIHIDKPTQTGIAPLTARTVATVESPAIRQLLQFMNRTSDNFTAEIMLKNVAAESGGLGTTKRGGSDVKSALTAIGAPTRDVRVADGSGLSSRDHISAQSMVRFLRRMDGQASTRDAFLGSLAVSGRYGTLHRRMKRAKGRILAKTGTLNQSVALSGYATSHSGRRYVFSIFSYAPGTRINAGSARKLHDSIGVRLAR
jgi:D-alanyl-D-alanine carboxypeptidase/D-alanyl-D-alanine-endopeptidase (penicillin-binding protein 4)